MSVQETIPRTPIRTETVTLAPRRGVVAPVFNRTPHPDFLPTGTEVRATTPDLSFEEEESILRKAALPVTPERPLIAEEKPFFRFTAPHQEQFSTPKPKRCLAEDDDVLEADNLTASALKLVQNTPTRPMEVTVRRPLQLNLMSKTPTAPRHGFLFEVEYCEHTITSRGGSSNTSAFSPLNRPRAPSPDRGSLRRHGSVHLGQIISPPLGQVVEYHFRQTSCLPLPQVTTHMQAEEQLSSVRDSDDDNEMELMTPIRNTSQDGLARVALFTAFEKKIYQTGEDPLLRTNKPHLPFSTEADTVTPAAQITRSGSESCSRYGESVLTHPTCASTTTFYHISSETKRQLYVEDGTPSCTPSPEPEGQTQEKGGEESKESEPRYISSSNGYSDGRSPTAASTASGGKAESLGMRLFHPQATPSIHEGSTTVDINSIHILERLFLEDDDDWQEELVVMQPSAAPYPQTMADAMLSLVEEQYKKLLYVHACSLVTIAETMAQEWQTMYQPAPRRPVASPRTPVAPLCAKEDSTASPRGQSTMGKLRSLFQPIKFMDEEKDNDVCSIHPERMKQAIWREDWEMDLESAHRRQLLQNYGGPSAMSLLFSLYVTQERDDAQRRKRGELPQGEVNSSMLVELYFNHKIRHHQRAVESILFDFTYLILVGIPAMRMLETHSRRLICMTRDLFIREQIELFVTTSPKYTKTARRAHRKELMLAPFRVAKWGWGDKPLPDTTKAIINNMGVDFKEKPSELPRAPTSPSTSSPRNVVFSVIEVGPAPSAAVTPTSSEEVSRPKGFLSRPLLERRGTPLSIQHSFVSGDSIHSSEVNIPKKNDTVHSHIKSHIKHLRSKSKSSTTSETTSVVRENSSGDYGRNLSVTEESRDFSRASAGSPLSLSKETTVVVESVPVAVKEEDAVVAIPQEKEAEAETPEVPEVVAPITEEVATAAVPAAVAAPEAAATLKGVKGRNKRERLHINGYYGRPPTQGTNLYKEMVREPSVSMLVHKKKTDEEPPATEPMLKPGRARRLSERSATSSRSTSRSMSNSNPTLPGRRRSSSSSTSGVLPPIPRIYRKYDTELDPHKDTYMSYSRVVKKGDGVNPPTLRARERMIPAKVQPVKGYVPPEPKSPKVEDIVGLDELVGNAKFDK